MRWISTAAIATMAMRSRSFAAIATVLATASAAFADADTMAGIKADCLGEWEGNYRMQEFCINQQLTSFNVLVRINNSGLNNEEKAILATCLGEWESANGSNWRMVKYCYEKQHEAYERLKSD